jgi:peptide/nickel transport system permease protein
LLLAIPLVFIVSILSFVLLSLTPGDAAIQILGNSSTPEAVEKLRHQLGLDLPLLEQYWRWLTNAASGDLGVSISTGQPVSEAIVQRLGVSLSLILGGLLVMVTAGIAIGVFSAVRGGAAGRSVDALALLALSLPSFWVGSILVEFFAVRLGVFPVSGYVSPATSPDEWLRSITLPVIALALAGTATVAKTTREAMLDVLASEHVRMAWANGVPPRSIYFVYALKNVGIRILTIVGVLVIGLLSGTVFIETVFALPGIGDYAVTGAGEQDVPVVQGVVIFFVLIIVFVNLLVDIAYTWLDPRVKTS